MPVKERVSAMLKMLDEEEEKYVTEGTGLFKELEEEEANGS